MLKIPINLDPDRVPDFFDYLVVKIESQGKWKGEGSFNESNQYIEKLYLSLSQKGYKDGQIVLTVIWNQDGTIEPIIIEKNGNLPDGWEQLANDLIREALVATVNYKREKYFCRYTYAYIGPPLDGEYYISGFRVAPAVFPDDDQWLIDERIIYIDLYEKGIDKMHAQAIGKVRAEQIVALLSVFLGIGIYSIPPERRWVLQDGKSCKRCQLGYFDSKPVPTKMPKKGEVCPLGHTTKVDRDKFDSLSMKKGLLFPNDIRTLFRCYYNLSPEKSKAYIGAASLFRISLTAGKYYPTVAMSYQIAAMDALVIGKEHNQKAFQELIQEFCPEAPAEFTSEIYGKIRSSHFHQGSLPGGEYEIMMIRPLRGPHFLMRFNLQREIFLISHTVLIRWLLKHGHC